MSTAGAGQKASEDDQGAEVIHLPHPPAPAPSPVWNDDGRIAWLYPLAALTLVLILAFLLAASAVRNSDFWLHLAGGKLVAEGAFPFATDPFCYAAKEGSWVNHSWLYDLALYGLFQMLGPTGLAILKAFTATGLAAVLLLSGKSGQGWTASIVGTILAILALSPWLALRPSLLSCLLLALTLWKLRSRSGLSSGISEGEVPARRARATWRGLKAYWPIPVLFAVWVNVDDWFFLGPLVAGLYVIGTVLPRAQPAETVALPAQGGREGAQLTPVLLFGLAACLLNPYFTQVFTLKEPLGLSESAAVIQEDQFLRRQWLARPENAYFSTGFFKTGPSLAFWLLTGLYLLSFAVLGKYQPWERLLSGTGLFLLCLVTTQAVPYFCIAAGPILALNLSAFRARPVLSAFLSWAALGRGVVLLALFLLCVFAWPGWVQNQSAGPRRWAIEMEPSLSEAGKQIATWRREGLLQPGNHGFHFSPEAANTFAWICPEEKGFLNAHRSGSAQAAADYIAVRNGLLGNDRIDWRSILRRQGITHVVLYNNDQRISERAIRFLNDAPKEWLLVYQRGRVAIFAWRDQHAARTSTAPVFQALNLDERAFSIKLAEQAPNSHFEEAPAKPHWWDAWWHWPPQRSLDADEARQEVTLFQAALPGQFKKLKEVWLPMAASRAAGVVAAAGAPLEGWPRGIIHIAGAESLFPVQIQEQLFFSVQDLGPAVPLYLAVRASRRALAADPADAAVYDIMGEAYFSLARLTRERTYQFPLLVHTRTIQAIAAFQQALTLNPNLENPRHRLVELYQKMGYTELMFEQIQQIQKRRQRVGNEQKQNMDKWMQILAKEVQDLRDKFALSSMNLKDLERARLALKLGLAGTALKILLASDISAFGAPGLDLELRLLLETGRLKDVRKWLEPSHEHLLGTSLYYQFRAKLAAAAGDYGRADKDWQASVLKLSDLARQPLSLQDGGTFMVGNAVLDGACGGPFAKFSGELIRLAPLKKKIMLLPDQYNVARYLWQLNFKLAEEANINVMRGLLALEAGQVSQARERFGAALKFYQSSGGMMLQNIELHSGRLIALQWLRMLEQVNRGL